MRLSWPWTNAPPVATRPYEMKWAAERSVEMTKNEARSTLWDDQVTKTRRNKNITYIDEFSILKFCHKRDAAWMRSEVSKPLIDDLASEFVRSTSTVYITINQLYKFIICIQNFFSLGQTDEENISLNFLSLTGQAFHNVRKTKMTQTVTAPADTWRNWDHVFPHLTCFPQTSDLEMVFIRYIEYYAFGIL